jgi:hypothetical protein
MAITKTITSDSGIEVTNAYIRIDGYSCNGENAVCARIRAYVSRELKKADKAPISGTEDIIALSVDYSDTAINPKKQIYEYMKTLEKYLGR